MSALNGPPEFRVPWHWVGALAGAIMAVGGAILGSVAGQGAYDAFARKDQIRQACIDGNENACRIYEVDHAR